MKVQINCDALAEFCRPRGSARQELFGSVLREDFRADSAADLFGTQTCRANLVAASS